jgi:hypothetical protein
MIHNTHTYLYLHILFFVFLIINEKPGGESSPSVYPEEDTFGVETLVKRNFVGRNLV